jgi:predicted metal-dependent enzyme (double-stranded beta helix superfamily)
MTAVASEAQGITVSQDAAPVSRPSPAGPALANPDPRSLDPGRLTPARLTPARPTPARLTAARLTAARLTPGELGQLVKRTAADDSWRQAVRFSRDRRWFQRLSLTEDYEIWLLSWLPGQHTGFHDHGDACGAFVVAQGEVRESLASVGSRRVRHRPAGEGTVTVFGTRYLHEVSNASAAPAVSVHAYSPPLTAMRRYEMTGSGLVLTGTEQSELDW